MLISILVFVLFGFVVGLAARALIGGAAGFWETSGLGMAGALIGSFLAYGVGFMRTPWSIEGFLISLLGAVALLAVSRLARHMEL